MSHSPMSWLKSYAAAYVFLNVNADLVSQPPIFWLKTIALRNKESKVVAAAVSHALMSWLKAKASANVYLIEVTDDVSHAPMSTLKIVSLKNKESKVVTVDTSQSDI